MYVVFTEKDLDDNEVKKVDVKASSIKKSLKRSGSIKENVKMSRTKKPSAAPTSIKAEPTPENQVEEELQSVEQGHHDNVRESVPPTQSITRPETTLTQKNPKDYKYLPPSCTQLIPPGKVMYVYIYSECP